MITVAHGRRAIETVRIIAPELSATTELAALAASEATTAEGVFEIEGAREILECLPGDRWAIVTSGIRAVAEFRLRHTQLPIPPVMICADEIARGKPHPEGYLTAAARLGFPAADCIVIEDSPAGIQSAHAAGMRAIAITCTYPVEQLTTAENVVAALIDLLVAQEGDEIRIDVTATPT